MPNPSKTLLTISTGFLVIYLITGWLPAVYISTSVGFIGIISDRLASLIDWLWMKLAWLLGLIVPNIVMGLVYYLLLFPIALLARVFRKEDLLMIKLNGGTTFRDVNKKFTKSSFERPW